MPVDPPRPIELPDTVEPLPPSDGFADAMQKLHLELEPSDIEQLGRYLALLTVLNDTMNLTRITDATDMWERHIADSLTLVPMIVSAEARTLMDVGSGGGLPGIPLAIVLPDVHVTLLEATGKKSRALQAMADHLGLTNIDVVNERAEDVGQNHHDHREQYDVVTARAVGALPVLLELTVPLAREEGHVLAIKGERAQEEIEAAKKAMHLLHCSVIDTVRTETGSIVIVEKARKTPRIYPRRAGEPKRAPL